MTSILIDSTVTGIATWGSLAAGEAVFVTKNGSVFAPATSYFMVPGAGIFVDVAGSMVLGGFSMNSGNSFTIEQSGMVHLQGVFDGLAVGGTTAGSTFRNYGTFTSEANGVLTDHASHLYNGGQLQAGSNGVVMNTFTNSGVGDTLVNDGTISARDLSGIYANGGTAHIANHGTIEALGNVSSFSQAGITTLAVSDIQNSGLIVGTNFGIWTSNGGQACTIHNSGTITGGQWSFSVNNGFVAVDRIYNSGVMNGDIYTGMGNDVVDTQGGTINGVIDLGDGEDAFNGLGATVRGAIYGGTGSDTYVTDDASLLIAESATPGEIDMVYATCNFRLGSYLEQLVLQGTADFRGWGNDLANTLSGNAGDNRLLGLDGNDTISGDLGNDRILGGAAQDSLTGDDGDDTLQGVLGNDTLNGGDGDDLIHGGLGRDVMTGGAGEDVFQFTTMGQSGSTQATADILTDFVVGEDQINLAALDAKTTNAAPNDAFTFITGAFTNVAGQLHAVQSGGHTYVEADVDGNGSADFMIRINPMVVLTAADFVL